MTNLENSPVVRRTTTKFKGRRIIVSLRADDVIELRLEHLRDSIKIPILELMQNNQGAAGAAVTIPARR